MFAYEYRYDNRGRMVMKILPRDGSSGSTTQYWYDRADRMAYKQAPAQMVGDSRHPFRFTGKELDRQNGLNWYDFGARWYDVAGVPMWTSVDPLAEKYYNVSPYVYCENNPVMLVDPNGKDWICATYDNEQFVYYDERIQGQDDIARYYSNSKTIKYLGSTGSIFQGTKNGDKLCYSLNSDGTYADADGNLLHDEVSIGNKLHVGSSVVQKNRQLEENMYGVYLGPNNPKTNENDIYAIPPIDMLDYAAFRHDKGYDSKNAVGVSGVFLNSSNYGDDWNLAVRSLNEVLTSDITSSRWRWALATYILFNDIAILKKIVRISK